MWQRCKETPVLELQAQKGPSVPAWGMQRLAYALKQEIFICGFSLFRKTKVAAFQLH